MKGNDILSVLFLALVCIVVSGIIYKLMPNHTNLIVPSFALIAVVLWVAYDYIVLNRYETMEHCKESRSNAQHLREMVEDINQSSGKISDIPEVYEVLDEKIKVTELIPEKVGSHEFDIDLYNDLTIMRDIHGEMGCSGDTRIFNRMKYMSIQPQVSKDIRAAWNARSFQPWVEEELRESEERDWWDDFEELDKDM